MYSAFTYIMPKSYKSIDCSICLNKLGNYIELSCGHRFHHDCIKKLFIIYMNDKWPLCKNIFTYFPSHNSKARKKLRYSILKKYSNNIGRMKRDDICNLAYYLSRHKVHISFIIRIVKVLQKYANEDINFIRYTHKQIVMYEHDCDCYEGRIMSICNDHLI